MDRLALDKNSPKTFILAAESWPEGCTEDDQVWSLAITPSESPPFHLYSTYGLKARAAQVFPQILFEGNHLTHQERTVTSWVTQYAPSFICLEQSYGNGLMLQFEAAVPEPFLLLGRLTLKNHGKTSLNFKLALAFHLLPVGKGLKTRSEKLGSHYILTAESGGLFPVLFMTDGPTAANTPYPALTLPLTLPPDGKHAAGWALAARRSKEDSLNTARRMVGTSWHQPQQKRLMEQAKETLQIRTGEPDWDTAFLLAQTAAGTHFLQVRDSSEAPAVIRNRLPDTPPLNLQHLNEQDNLTTLELTHLAQVLLPQRATLLASLVTKFLNQAKSDGHLHAQRNTSPFITPYNEPPLLAALTLEIFEVTRDESFIKQAFPTLSQLTDAWLFSDPDSRLLRPFAWQSPDQCQLDSGLFPFDIWDTTGGGLDIRTVESPALLAMLLRETRSLATLARALSASASAKRWEELAARLQEELEKFWVEDQKMYLYRDYQSHATHRGEDILRSRPKQSFKLDHQLNPSQRLVCHLIASDERTRVCELEIAGLDPGGAARVESYHPGDIRWISGRAHITTRGLFSFVASITLSGLMPEDEIHLDTADLFQGDITCFAPIWTGAINPNHYPALIEKHLNPDLPGLQRGIPEIHPNGKHLPEGLQNQVNVLWNTLTLQGLLRNGAPGPAAALFTNLMRLICKGLKDYGGFFPFYGADDGRPGGTRNTIAGLAPLRLFMEIAGIRLFSPWKVALWGTNPFPWPIEIHWQGLSIHRSAQDTAITFPDGTTCTIDSTQPVTVTPESLERRSSQ